MSMSAAHGVLNVRATGTGVAFGGFSASGDVAGDATGVTSLLVAFSREPPSLGGGACGERSAGGRYRVPPASLGRCRAWTRRGERFGERGRGRRRRGPGMSGEVGTWVAPPASGPAA